MDKDDTLWGIDAARLREDIQHLLNIGTFRGISLQELDYRLQDQRDLTLDAYLLWLQDQMNGWDWPDFTTYHPQIQSFCDRLRHHRFNDNHILNSFLVWKSVHLKFNISLEHRIQQVENKLRQYLSLNSTSQQRRPRVRVSREPRPDPHYLGTDFGMHRALDRNETLENGHLTRKNVFATKPSKIDILLVDKKPDIEFSNWDDPNPNHLAIKDRMTRFQSHSSAIDKANRINITSPHSDDARGPSKIGTTKNKGEDKGGKLSKGYVCNRCNEQGKAQPVFFRLHFEPNIDQIQSSTGHLLKDCPTNLDPSYDAAPPAGYQCNCCGAIENHFYTLCPDNGSRGSLTQLRIQAGITTAGRNNNRADSLKGLRTNANVSNRAELRKSDHYRPAVQQSNSGGLAQRKVNLQDTNSSIHAERQAMLGSRYSDDCNEVALDEFRDEQGKRSYSRHQSPSDDRRRDSKQHSSPPHKRSRRDNWEPERDLSCGRGRGHLFSDRDDRPDSNTRGQNSHSDREGPSGVLSPSARRDGRLSYWDGYECLDNPRSHSNSFNVREPDSLLISERLSELRAETRVERRPEPRGELRVKSVIPTISSSPLRVIQWPAAVGFCSDDREAEIEERFPDADRAWVKDMASFDVDTFFDELDDFMAARGDPQLSLPHFATSLGASLSDADFTEPPEDVSLLNEPLHSTNLQDGQELQPGINSILRAVEEDNYATLSSDARVKIQELQGEMADEVRDNKQSYAFRNGHGTEDRTLKKLGEDIDNVWKSAGGQDDIATNLMNAPGRCKRCHMEGHATEECPKSPSRRCTVCGGHGHRAKRCLNKPVWKVNVDDQA